MIFRSRTARAVAASSSSGPVLLQSLAALNSIVHAQVALVRNLRSATQFATVLGREIEGGQHHDRYGAAAGRPCSSLRNVKPSITGMVRSSSNTRPPCRNAAVGRKTTSPAGWRRRPSVQFRGSRSIRWDAPPLRVASEKLQPLARTRGANRSRVSPPLDVLLRNASEQASSRMSSCCVASAKC